MLIGEEDWQAMEETLHLMAIPGMAESIIEGGKTAIEDCLEEKRVHEDVEYQGYVKIIRMWTHYE